MKERYFDILIKTLDYIDEGIQIIDNNGKIMYSNKSTKSLDEIEIDKTIGRHILEIYPSLTFETSTLLQVMQTCKPILNKEQNFINYKGDKISTINTSLPIVSNNKIIGAIEISKNITTVKELSEKIVDLQTELFKNNTSKKKSKRTADYTFVDIIGQNNEMLKLKTLSTKASLSNAPVLVCGNTGTGKELFVQSIHNSSSRKNKPFIAQNCAALPSNLLESILFGSVKGSFTGAENRAGLFELADGGTLFLDEINSMPLELQAKLLRVIQDKRIRRVGSTSTIDVDVRIITAMNTNIEEVVEAGLIRRDLFYRLNVISLIIPDLVDRLDDMPLLIDFFIDKFNKKYNKYFTSVSKNVFNIFISYSWPGNVRELEHTIESVISLYDSAIIREEHLPYQFNKTKLTSANNLKIIKPLNESVEKLEKEIILAALKQTNHNITKTAELIDIPRQTLQYKIKKYGF